MELVGTLYSNVPDAFDDSSHQQNLTTGADGEGEYFFFSDGQSEASDTEIGHSEVIIESASNIYYDENQPPDIMHEDIELEHEEDVISHVEETVVDEGYRPVLDEKEREKVYRMAIIDSELTPSPRGSKFYNCDQCDESFARKVMLEKHIEKFHQDDPRPYTCTICLKKFKKRSKLQKHSWTHIGQLVDQKKPKSSKRASLASSSDAKKTKSKGFVKKGKHSRFNCDKCTESFSNPTKLLNHKKKVHIPINRCIICEEEFETRKALEAHRRELHPNERPYRCSFCKKRFISEALLINHNRLHNGEAPFRCTPCDRGFLSRRNLERHLDTHIESQCKVCGKMTFTSKEKKAHEKKHLTPEDLYDCRFCGESFSRTNDLTRHCNDFHSDMMTSSKPKSSNNSQLVKYCKICSIEFKNPTQYRKHYVLTHSEPFFCRYCPKRFRRIKMVEKHEKQFHSTQMVFECKNCNETFRVQHELKTHSRVEHGALKRRHYSLNCTVCGAKFEKPTYLEAHKRVHDHEKPFQCEKTGLRFTQLSMLKSHNDMLASNKVYECQICTRKFTKASAMQEHQVVHSGLGFRSLASGCEDQVFTDQMRMLKYERRVHAGENVFQCLVCHQSFDHRACLFRHEFTHSTGDQPLFCIVGGVQISDNIVVLDYKTECFLARRREQMLALHLG